MKRRKILKRAAIAIGAVVSISGCTSHSLQESEREPPLFDGVGEEEIDLPVPQPLGEAETGIERASTEGLRDSDEFRTYLDDSGVDVRHVEEALEAGEPILSLKYTVDERSETGLMHHLGVVAGGYAALVEAGHESEKLVVHVLDSESAEFGEYEIRRHWAEAYNDGELTAREYADEITVTIKSA